MNSTQSELLRFTPNVLQYLMLWLKVSLLKLVSFGVYAPWGSDTLRQYLLRQFRLDGNELDYQSSPLFIFKVRFLFISLLIFLILLNSIFPVMTWLLVLLLIAVTPGFYMAEKNHRIKCYSINNESLQLNYSLFSFYQTLALPLGLFLFVSILIFNSALIDSRFLASIESKEEARVFAQDSYISAAEKALTLEPHQRHSADEHGHEDEYWSDSIPAEEIAYLEEHEKSHNHGSIALSRMEKYRLASQGNVFIQYTLVFLLLFIVWPWIDNKILLYRIQHTSFRNSSWRLKASLGSFYRIYLKVVLLNVLMITFFALAINYGLMGNEGSSPEFWSNALVHGIWLIPLMLFLLLFSVLQIIEGRRQWVLQHVQLVPFRIEFKPYFAVSVLLSIFNSLLLIGSLGLAIPYCQLQSYRLLTKNLNLRLDH
jgi:uncharacterized membrane protein YjgN (DUF898 family)